MSPIRWLRISYWIGALVDGAAAVLMYMPEAGRALYGVTDFQASADYRYAMRFGAALMVGWTLLLLWADRRPVERRGVLPLTVVVIGGLASAGAYAVSADLVELAYMLPTWVLQLGLAALFVYSYWVSRDAARSASLPIGHIALEDAAAEFLAQGRFAVAGVSRDGQAAANFIFKRFKESGREVYPVNPNADTVEGEPCYTSLAALPNAPDAVVVATHPDRAIDVARDCRDLGVSHVWFHRSIDGGSFSPEAAALCADYGATVIPGGCPMMHLEPVDMGHRCMRGVLGALRALPVVAEPKPR